MNPIMQGLSISIIGLVMAFVSMSLLILVIVGLQKIFPYKPETVLEIAQETVIQGNLANSPEFLEQVAAAVAVEALEDKQIAAAITAAVHHLGMTNQNGLGRILEQGQGQWWYAGQKPTLVKKSTYLEI